MRTRWLETLAAVGMIALLPVLAAASPDAPHDASFDTGDCTNCHTMFDTTATGAKDYTNACMGCHNKIQHQNGPNGFPWYTDQQAVPGVRGDHHSWSGAANNADLGARQPSSSLLTNKLVDGKLQCAVCHDAHNANRDFSPSSRTTSMPVGVPQGATGGTGGSGTLTLVDPGTAANGWRLQLTAVGGGGGKFVLSHTWNASDPAARTWLNWSAATSTWVAGTETGEGKPFVDGQVVALDDATVTVRLGAGNVVGNSWDFWVGYPFLRASNVADALCTSCHAERFMNAARGGGRDPAYRPNGVAKFSHPVGDALGSNGRGYDRAEPLDPDGAPQSAGDTNKTNDLELDGTIVRCTTCHAVHGADSNSLSKDAR